VLTTVMPGTAVKHAQTAYTGLRLPGIHVFRPEEGVDGRDNGVPAAQAQRGSRPGHDELKEWKVL
jgi:hypothetical protein